MIIQCENDKGQILKINNTHNKEMYLKRSKKKTTFWKEIKDDFPQN